MYITNLQARYELKERGLGGTNCPITWYIYLNTYVYSIVSIGSRDISLSWKANEIRLSWVLTTIHLSHLAMLDGMLTHANIDFPKKRFHPTLEAVEFEKWEQWYSRCAFEIQIHIYFRGFSIFRGNQVLMHIHSFPQLRRMRCCTFSNL